MKVSMRQNLPSTRPRHRAVDILCIAAWFGLVTGLLEGLGFLVFQQLRWLAWNMALMPVSLEIIWISPLFDLLLFSVLGIVLVVGCRCLPWLPLLRLSVFLFAFLGFFNWWALTGRFSHTATVLLAAGLATVLTRWFCQHEGEVLHFWHRSLP